MTFEQAEWFKRLGNPEQQDNSNVVSILDDWANIRSVSPEDFVSRASIDYALEHDLFYALYAVGSVITDKPNPADIDLLLVTNNYINYPFDEPKFDDLIDKLKETHTVSVDDKVSERYDHESDCRIKIDLQLKDRSAKPIDVIYQYDIISARHWEANDQFDAVPIFKIGAENPVGKGNKRFFHRNKNIPLDMYRISQAFEKGLR